MLWILIIYENEGIQFLTEWMNEWSQFSFKALKQNLPIRPVCFHLNNYHYHL